MAGSGVQDICSMKPRFRNANLFISHVLDWYVKLLAVLHMGRSVDLSVEIATGRRMIDIIATHGRLAVAQYGALYHINAIAALADRSCCIIHRAVPHAQLYGLAEGGS